MSSQDQTMDLVLMIVIGSGVLLLPLIAMTAKRVYVWKGGWKFGALLPLLAMAGLVIHMAMHPRSAGLWPIVIIFWELVAAVALIAITGIYNFSERVASCPSDADDKVKPDAD